MMQKDHERVDTPASNRSNELAYIHWDIVEVKE